VANREHLDIARAGVNRWNAWRKGHANIKPDLSRGDLRVTDLAGYNFASVNLCNADLSWVNLKGANLADVDLTDALLYEAHLEDLDFREAIVDGAVFANARLARADFSGVAMDSVNFKNADLEDVSLVGATLTEADFTRANLIRIDFRGADLEGTKFDQATMIATNFSNSQLSGSSVYGVSAWNVILKGAQQTSLVITPEDEASITVDNLEVAQFVYLMLHNEKIRDVIDTITSTAVLVLGRFSKSRMAVLKKIQASLRERNYIPIVYDFEGPRSKTTMETVGLLGRMVRFIIVDVTDAKSVLQELREIVPINPSVPVQPVILSSQVEPGMFDFFRTYHWFLPTYK